MEMESYTKFSSLSEFIRALDRERSLIQALFQDRKKLSLSYDLARDLASRKDESITFLKRYGIIRENDHFIELEELYLRFFEEVLQVNEEINISSVKESIDNLNAAIEYYQLESDTTRKYGYLREVKKILRQIALSSMRNVIDLKRKIDNTYKNQPNFEIKKKELIRLDEKRRSISLLIEECEKMIDEKQIVFFKSATDVQLKDIVTDVKFKFCDVCHNLFELDKQIINYLNLIEYQNRLYKKVQKLKYLRDHLLLETSTDICSIADSLNPVWMEPRPKYSLLPSISNLRNTDLGLQIIKAVTGNSIKSKFRKNLVAEPLSHEELLIDEEQITTEDLNEIKNAFVASGDHLYRFIMTYSGYRKKLDYEDKLVLYCQLATEFFYEFSFTDKCEQDNEVSYAIIYPKKETTHEIHKRNI